MKRDVDRREVVHMYRRLKLSTRAIGRRVGLSPGAVRSILVSRGIVLRSIKMAIRLAQPNGRNGENASNWRGGRRRAGAGYVYIYSPNHPYATKDGYVMEHRLIVEKRMGRVLEPHELVHHKNGSKADNRDENLQYVPSKSQHVKEHFLAVRKVHALEARIAQLEAFIRANGLTPPA